MLPAPKAPKGDEGGTAAAVLPPKAVVAPKVVALPAPKAPDVDEGGAAAAVPAPKAIALVVAVPAPKVVVLVAPKAPNIDEGGAAAAEPAPKAIALVAAVPAPKVVVLVAPKAPKGDEGGAAAAVLLAAGAEAEEAAKATLGVDAGVPPTACIIRAKSASVDLMPWVSQGRADEARAGIAATGVAFAPEAPTPKPKAGDEAAEAELPNARGDGAGAGDEKPAGADDVAKEKGLETDDAEAKERALAAVKVGDAPVPKGEPDAGTCAAAAPLGFGDAAANWAALLGPLSPAMPILRAKSASVGLMPCVSHGLADADPDFVAVLTEGGGVLELALPNPNFMAPASAGFASPPVGTGVAVALAATPKLNLGAPNCMPAPAAGCFSSLFAASGFFVSHAMHSTAPAAGCFFSLFAASGFFVSHAMHLGIPSSLITRQTAHRHSLPSGSSFGGLKSFRFCAVSSSSELPMSASESSEPTSDSLSSTKSSFGALSLSDLLADLLGVLLGVLVNESVKISALAECPAALSFCNSPGNPRTPTLSRMRANSSRGTGSCKSPSARVRAVSRPGILT